MASELVVFRNRKESAEVDAPWSGEVVSGNPHTKTWNLFTSSDNKIFAGIWEGTPGVWRFSYDDWEYCHLLSGRCTVTLDGELPVEMNPGDVFILEPGAKGLWTVNETMRKYYVFVSGGSQ